MRALRLTLPALSFVLLTSPLVRFPDTRTCTRARDAPETYTATLQVKGHATASTTIRIELQRYSADRDREPVEKGLKFGGYPGVPGGAAEGPEGRDRGHGRRDVDDPVGECHVRRPGGRKIVLITDEPMYFLGGGAKDAKPRAGYEVGVIQMEVDAAGNGTGSVAAAAKVKPGEDGVIVDDYGDQRIEIAKIVREKP